jgi:hypothetical protein
MIDMAHAAKYHWRRVGTPVNQVRGDYLCSRVYAFVGRAEPALHHARRAAAQAGSSVSRTSTSRSSTRHSRALACAGDAEGARRELDLVRAVAIADAEDREIFDADLAKQPWFGITV